MFVIYVILAILVGCGFATQTAITSKLSASLSSPIDAVLLSFVVGSVAVLSYKVFTGNILVGIRGVSPWLYVSGGTISVLSLITLVFITPKMGISLSIGIMVAAQLTLALLFDHFGVLGLEVRSINLYKIIGVLCLLLGTSLCLYFR